MSYRNDVDALAAYHAALEEEVAQKTRERDQAASLLNDAKARARLPVLDNIRVASPCNADWSKMTGDDRVRHCGDCKKNVYNVSEMTRDEALSLISEHETQPCIRYFQRKDGTILLKDCEIGVRRSRRRRLVVAGAAASILAGAAFSYAKASEKHVMGSMQPVIEEPMPVMGAMPLEPDADMEHEDPKAEIEVRMGK